MRRIVMATAVIAALAMALPGLALAAHRHGHHGYNVAHRSARHGHRHHRRRDGRARRARRRAHHSRHGAHHGHLVTYSLAAPLGEEGKQGEKPEAGEPSVEGEEAAGGAGSESIGTVVSFEEGVLSIEIADGTVLSGKVTGETRLLCVSSEPPTFTGGEDRGAGDDRGAEDRDQGDLPAGEGEGEEGMEGGGGEHGDSPPGAYERSFEHPDIGFFAPCEPTALTPETAVREAELRLGPEGAVWERVVLD